MTAPPKLEKQQVANYYRQMLLIRRFEEESGRLYMQGKIRGFIHLYIGQEAVAVGAISALDPEDYVISHYRDHGHALAKGLDPKKAMAEIFGKATGVSGGRGGHLHRGWPGHAASPHRLGPVARLDPLHRGVYLYLVRPAQRATKTVGHR